MAGFNAKEPGGGFQSHSQLTQARGNKTNPSRAEANGRVVVANVQSAIDHSQNLHLVRRQWQRCSGIRFTKLHRKERVADQKARAKRSSSIEIGANERRFEVVKINAGQ